MSVPEKDTSLSPRSHVHRWKLLNQSAQSFWRRRWRDEYLNTLQTRSRWTKNAPNISVNDLVVIKDPNTPPLKWRTARVIEVIFTRPVVKIVKLPT